MRGRSSSSSRYNPSHFICPFPPIPLFLPDRPPHPIIFSPLPTSFDSIHIVVASHLITYPLLSCLNYCRVFRIPSFDFPCLFLLFLQNLKTCQQLKESKPFRLCFLIHPMSNTINYETQNYIMFYLLSFILQFHIFSYSDIPFYLDFFFCLQSRDSSRVRESSL